MSEDAKQVFAQNLRQYLEAKGLSQLDLAAHMGCSSSTVSGVMARSIPAWTKCSALLISLVSECPN